MSDVYNFCEECARFKRGCAGHEGVWQCSMFLRGDEANKGITWGGVMNKIVLPLTKEEKETLARMINPSCIEDYGLTVTVKIIEKENIIESN